MIHILLEKSFKWVSNSLANEMSVVTAGIDYVKTAA